MSEFNSDFLNEVCEYVFGDEFTKQDQRNLLRNLNPAFEGTGILKFGTILNSQHFMEFVVDLWENKQQLYEARRRYKQSLKTDKDYDVVCNQLNQERQDCKNKILEIREKYETLEKENVNNNPLYKKLEHDYKILYNKYLEQDNKLENQEKLKENITNAMLEKSNAEVRYKEFYKEKYNKDIKKYDKECDKQIRVKEQECDKKIKDYVRQDDKICHMEKNERIKKLEKQVKLLQQQLIQSMSD